MLSLLLLSGTSKEEAGGYFPCNARKEALERSAVICAEFWRHPGEPDQSVTFSLFVGITDIWRNAQTIFSVFILGSQVCKGQKIQKASSQWEKIHCSSSVRKQTAPHIPYLPILSLVYLRVHDHLVILFVYIYMCANILVNVSHITTFSLSDIPRNMA